MKRVLILFMCFVLFLLPVGCSDDNVDVEEETTTSGTEIEVTYEDDDVEEADNQIYSDDVKQFVEDFNQLASLEDAVPLIEDVQPAKEDEDGYTQVLYSSTSFAISALYEKNGEVKSYVTVISEDEPYHELKGDALYALLHVGSALGVDVGELSEEFEKALPNHAGMYFTDDYTITFSTNDQVSEIGMITMFINSSLTDDNE